MNLLSCPTVMGMLPWFVGADLDRADSEAVRRHLLDCAACRREAGALQQSTRVLKSLGAADAARLDDGTFAAMHRSIVQAVAGAAARVELSGRPPFWRRTISIAAATTLFLSGWWLVQSSRLDVFQRQAIGTPVADGDVRVVPYSGPRVSLQPLGFEPTSAGGGAATGVGPGMMGRGRLRALVDDVNPVVPVVAEGR